MALTEETRLAEIEILASGRIQFREESQIFKDGRPLGSPEYHRSGVDPGHLDADDNLIPNPLPSADETLGLITDIDLNKLLEAVRTPAIMAKWKAKLIAEKIDLDKRTKTLRAEEERTQASLKAAEEKRIADAVAEELKRHKITK